MTVKQFMKELAKHRGKFKVQEKGELRARRSSRKISVFYRGPHCPITKVYYSISKISYSGTYWGNAVTGLGLGTNNAVRIVEAADNNLKTATARILRRQMLKVLGLKEVA